MFYLWVFACRAGSSREGIWLEPQVGTWFASSLCPATRYPTAHYRLLRRQDPPSENKNAVMALEVSRQADWIPSRQQTLNLRLKVMICILIWMKYNGNGKKNKQMHPLVTSEVAPFPSPKTWLAQSRIIISYMAGWLQKPVQFRRCSAKYCKHSSDFSRNMRENFRRK
jgi:hypothetical protein